MKPNLYICHTAYQVLVDLLRAGRCAGKPHTMVLSASVPDTAALSARLDATGVVNELLLASVEGVASVAKLDGELRNSRVGLEGVAAGATDGALDVLGVDTLLHDKTPYGR